MGTRSPQQNVQARSPTAQHPLLSSSAKTDDPVNTERCRGMAVPHRRIGGYWMPAFAGMTTESAAHQLMRHRSRKLRLRFQIMLGHCRPEFFHQGAVELDRRLLLG